MFTRKHILVVEDNVLNREMLTEILADKYDVLEAENGQKALEILRQHRDDITLVLLDIVMPVMDGYTFLDIMKSDIELAGIPVIVMTQGDKEEDELVALSHGTYDYIPKPYRPSIILHRIASIINLRESVAMVNQFKHERITGLYSKEYFYRRAEELLQ